MTNFPSTLAAYPAIVPYVAQIPGKFRQGDSAQWIDVPFTDVNGTHYDSSTYTLRYTLAGPIAAPVVITATANGVSWQSNLTTTVSATLVPGKYWYSAQVFATGVRVTLAEGEVIVAADLAIAGANYDGSSVAEKALAAAENALAVFQSSGGRTKAYTIGGRSMTFQDDAAILKVIEYWKVQVRVQEMKASGGMERLILTRFQSAR